MNELCSPLLPGRGRWSARFSFAFPRRSCSAAIIALTFSCQVVSAQSLDEINKRAAALVEAWEKTPLTIQRALFVTEEPQGYGIYTPRESSKFKQGEPIIVYAEPVAFGWRKVEDDQYEFGFKVDLILKSPDGKVLAEKDDFGNLVLKSRERNREFLIHLTLNLNSASPGDYILDYKLRDVVTDKTAIVELPFTIE